jgi:hypothetical protein
LRSPSLNTQEVVPSIAVEVAYPRDDVGRVGLRGAGHRFPLAVPGNVAHARHRLPRAVVKLLAPDARISACEGHLAVQVAGAGDLAVAAVVHLIAARFHRPLARGQRVV